NTAALQAQLRAAEAISGIIDSSSSPDLERIAPVMANIDSQALVSLSERLIRMREERISVAITNHKRLLEAYNRSSKEGKPSDKTTTPTGFTAVGSQGFQRVAGGLFRRDEKLNDPPPPGSPTAGKLGSGLVPGERRRIETVFVASTSAAVVSDRPLSSAVSLPSLQNLVDWAQDSGQLTAEA